MHVCRLESQHWLFMYVHCDNKPRLELCTKLRICELNMCQQQGEPTKRASMIVRSSNLVTSSIRRLAKSTKATLKDLKQSWHGNSRSTQLTRAGGRPVLRSARTSMRVVLPAPEAPMRAVSTPGLNAPVMPCHTKTHASAAEQQPRGTVHSQCLADGVVHTELPTQETNTLLDKCA